MAFLWVLLPGILIHFEWWFYKAKNIFSSSLLKSFFFPKWPDVLSIKFKFISTPSDTLCATASWIAVVAQNRTCSLFTVHFSTTYHSLVCFLFPSQKFIWLIVIFYLVFQSQQRCHFFWVSFSKYPRLDYGLHYMYLHKILYLAHNSLIALN